MIDTLDNPLVTDCNELSTIDSHTTLDQAIASLSPEQPFASFDLVDLGLTKDKMDLLNQVQINFFEPPNDGRFLLDCVANSCSKDKDARIKRIFHDIHFHDIHTYESDIQHFIEGLSVQNEQIAASVANIITVSISNVLSKLQDKILYFVEVRAEYAKVQPEPLAWHIDYGIGRYATILPLKGPHTLFCPSDKVDRIQDTWHREKDICRGENFINSTDGRGDVFLVGYEIPGATHSRPARNEARLLALIRPFPKKIKISKA